MKPSTPGKSSSVEALQRFFLLARNSLLTWAITDRKALGILETAPYVAYDGAAVAPLTAGPQPAMDANGRYYHSVQIVLLNGAAEVLKVQGSLDGSTPVDVPVVNVAAGGAAAVNMSANGMYAFSGVFSDLRVVKVSGTQGTTTKAYLAGLAP